MERHDPGGKVRTKVVEGTLTFALFEGENDCYRTELMRCWEPGAVRRACLFVMMNPSTADEEVNDPTVTRCIGFAKRWGFNTLLVGNTFGLRATDQTKLTEARDPIGPGNDAAVLRMAQAAERVVFAYGTPKHNRLRQRGPELARKLIAAGVQPMALKLSAKGIPWHPLYLPGDAEPFPWSPT